MRVHYIQEQGAIIKVWSLVKGACATETFKRRVMCYRNFLKELCHFCFLFLISIGYWFMGPQYTCMAIN